MAIREGRWRCKHCQVENLGRHKVCVGLDENSGCGKKRGKVKFYLPGNATIVTDPELIRLARSGPDDNGQDVPEAEVNQTGHMSLLSVADTGLERLAAPKPDKPALKLFGRNPTDLIRMEKEARQELLRKIEVGLLIGAFLLAAAIVVWRTFFATFSVEAHIESFAWNRSVNIESYQTVRESGWSLPLGGQIVTSQWKIRHYEKVFDHYETKFRQVSETVQTGNETYSCGHRDLGNGFFEELTCSRPIYETRYRTESYDDPVYRDEPVYDTHYTYDIEKWLYDRTERSAGKDQAPVWPVLSLDKGRERVSRRKESYNVNFKTAEGEMITYEYPEAEWEKMELGQKYRIDRNRVGLIQAIERL